MQMPTDQKTDLAWAVEAQLGEGPVWVQADRALWFTDIKRKQVHRYDPASGNRSSWDAPEQIGFVLPAEGSGFVAGLQSGLHRFDPGAGSFELIARIDADRPGNRLNDATVAPDGRLWFGTMDDGEGQPSGSFYSFKDGRLMPSGIGGIAITNGPAISPDGTLLYWVDTRGGGIFKSPILADGAVGESELLIQIPPDEGNPDGPSVDSDGCIWVGLYGGWQARRYSPAGELLHTQQFPVANITKIALGGPDLRTAFATTARQKLSPQDLEMQPDAGGLFSFQVEVPGSPSPLVKL